MPDLEPNNQSIDAMPLKGDADSLGEAAPATVTDQAPASNTTQNAEAAPVTRAQAEQILAELKTIKQNLLWVLLLGGFLAARAFFFHY